MVTNKINNKKYIGQHRGSFKSSYLGSGKIIVQAINKNGKDAFDLKVICLCKDLADLNDKEIYYIAELDAVNREDFYNIRPGGNMRYIPTAAVYTEERRQKNRQAHLGMKYKPMSAAGRANISKAVRGRKLTKERRAQISKAVKGRHWINNGKINKMVHDDIIHQFLEDGWLLGMMPAKTPRKPLSAEAREHHRLSKLGTPRSKESCLKQAETMKGHVGYNKSTIWVNNDTSSRMVSPTELQKYLDLGYKKGRGKLKK